MSQPWVPSGQQPPAPPADDSSPAIPLWVILVAVGLLMALVAAAVYAFMQMGNTRSTSSYPEEWDSRVAPYAAIAEDQRDLQFLHPVTVRFLSPAKFEKGVTRDDKDLTKQDRTDIRQFTGLMRAFGLITGDVDLFAAFNDASGGGTLAYYSFKDERITIRGHKLTPAVGSTLVHEMTHALQDQHFQIGDRVKQLHKSKDDQSGTEASVLDAIIEGDASRVQTLYRESLTAKERKALDTGRVDEGSEAMKRLKNVPKVVLTLIASPYTLGEALVQTVAVEGDNAAVDDLFRDAPTHESSLFDPFLVLSGQTSATELDPPRLDKGEKKFDSGELGVLTWYLMLAERLPLQDALAAADGWGGDRYVAFERRGSTCARTTYTGRTPVDTARMLSALQRWVAAAPGSPARVSRAGAVLRFTSCDPGAAADVGKDASQDAVGLVATRTYLGVVLLRSGLPEDGARCLAGRLVEVFPVAKLVDPEFGADDPAVQDRIGRLAAGCR